MNNHLKILILYTLILFLSGLLIPGFTPEKLDTDLRGLEWFLGDWESDDGKTITRETWKKVSPKTYEGKGFTENKLTREILNSETLRLAVMSDDIFYIADVSHNEFPVAFRLTESTDSLAVFENKTHDFPKKIEYKLISIDSMNVSVSAGDQGFIIRFVRVDDL
ncbi:MAG: DUF6265 family protein [Calditrichaceae bacterium]